MTLPRYSDYRTCPRTRWRRFADGVLSARQRPAAPAGTAPSAPSAPDAVRIQREVAMMLRTAPAPTHAGRPARPAGRAADVGTAARRFGGLPTALDPNGVPMFVAHQAPTKRSTSADRDAAGEPGADPVGPRGDDRASFVGAPTRAVEHPDQARSGHRRMLLPVRCWPRPPRWWPPALSAAAPRPSSRPSTSRPR